MKLAVIDYGLCNLLSVYHAFHSMGVEAQVTSDPEVVLNADAAILPGVGAFGDGMKGLRDKGLIKPIDEFVKTGKPFLGICLGAQMLLTRSHEFGVHEGLNFIPGEVRGFKGTPEVPLKIPHIGWNQLRLGQASWEGTILEGLKDGEQMYFVHSFYLDPADQRCGLARTEYGNHKFCSVVAKGNVYGCQFHPEKSAGAGLKILNNFVHLIKRCPL